VHVTGYDRSATIDGLPEGLVPELGQPHPPGACFSGIDLLVLSPGVPPDPLLEQQRRLAPDSEVHGEMSLALELVHRDDQPWQPVPTVLVTGTNGKSTVTALTGTLLEAGGKHPFVGGNLGAPLCNLLLDHERGDQPWPDTLVLECSSFQLETLRPYSTQVAMVLNITPDHLDRYSSMDAYAATKARVFAGLGPDDIALLDADDPWTDRIAPTGKTTIARIGSADGGIIDGDGPGRALVLRGGERYTRDLLGVAGRHNSKNALFGLIAARHLEVPPDACRKGLGAFVGLPHRMSLVRDLDGVTYYDDSKATNVASVLASLDGFDRPVVLVAGGRPKGDDFEPLRELLARRGRALVAIGEAANELHRLVSGTVHAVLADAMDDAVAQARGLARPGDAVVLSPACASFDQFRSYSERGDAFIRAVRALD
jgi:UDP-N-acetylmuramoylalanine--D-glutamate ligase